jgi:hypothetical protein
MLSGPLLEVQSMGPTLRPLLTGLTGIALLLALVGCFESHDGALAVTIDPGATTWTTDQGPHPALTVTVRNDEAKDAVNVSVRIDLEVLSGNSIGGDASAMTLASLPAGVTGSQGDYVIATLPAHGSVVFTPAVFLEPGTYRWRAVVDGDGKLEEFNEKDNVASSLVTVTAAAAVVGLDVALGAPTAITPVGTDLVDITLPVTVTGPAGAKAFMVRIDSTLLGDTGFYVHYEGFLAVGAHTLHLTARAPAGGSGTYRIVLDSGGYLPEADETNNLISVAFPFVAPG